MEEQLRSIELRKINQERTGRFRVYSETGIPTTKFAHENKSIIDLDLGGKHEASLYLRILEDAPSLLGFSGDEKPTLFSEKYVKVWQLLKERGMPVVDTVRVVNENTVAVTNLSKKGSVYDAKIDSLENREVQPEDNEFLQIPISDIRNEALELLEFANERGIVLPPDGPFHIFVEKKKDNGTFVWKLMMIDLTNVTIYKDPRALPNSSKEDSDYVVKRWAEQILIVRRNIKNSMTVD